MWRWAIITSVDPLRVRYAEETTPLEATPDNLVGGLKVGDRVRIHRYGSTLTIVGVSGGAHTPTPDGATLNFGQWNIRSAAYSDESKTQNVFVPPSSFDGGIYRWSQRKGKMAATIAASGVDILTTQESGYPGAPNQDQELLAALRAAAPTQGWQCLDLNSTQAIFYRGGIWEWTGVGGTEPSPWTGWTMIWGLFRHQTTGIGVIIASDHWHASDGAITRQCAENTNQILTVLGARYGVPVVLGADTNDYGPTQGQAIAAMNGRSFKDIRTVFPAARRSEWATWHNYQPMMNGTELGQANHEWIDQIFISGPATITSGGIYDTTLPLTSALASDHHYLTATIDLANTGTAKPDTGWRPHGGTYAPGWSDSPGDPIQYRIIDGIVYWRGSAIKTSNIGDEYVIRNIAGEARPLFSSKGYAMTFTAPTTYGGITGGIYPDENGSLYVYSNGTQRGFRLGGSYPLA